MGYRSKPRVNALDITDIVGGWSNEEGGYDITINNVAAQGTDTIMWGSGYEFTPGGDILSVPLDTNVLLGTFVHVNEPIRRGRSITSVDYDLSFSSNGVPVTLSTTLMFDHYETYNRADPCADGGPNSVGVNSNGCADIVTITSAVLNAPIDVGEEIFYFNLLGFSLDAGLSFDSQFFSEERGSNAVGLYGMVGQRISVPQLLGAPTQVPEPSTLALLLAGLIGVAWPRRASN
jgi:hypothetical protein